MRENRLNLFSQLLNSVTANAWNGYGVAAGAQQVQPTPPNFLNQWITFPAMPPTYTGPVGTTKPLKKELVAGPIVGWRLWGIDDDGRLHSIAYVQVIWPDGEPLEGGIAEGNNTIGIHALKLRGGLHGVGYAGNHVIGQVALWGKVIEHEHGYRAQYAYPMMIDMSLKSPMPGFPVSVHRQKLAEKIRERYGCEVLA